MKIDSVPEKYLCPLTLEIMVHPLMTKAGHSFERSAIFEWLRVNDVNPLTREPLSPRDLVLNHALKMEIRQWRTRHHIEIESDTEESSESEGDSDVPHQYLFISRSTLKDMETGPTAVTISYQAPREVSSADTPRSNRRGRFSLAFRRRR